MRFRTHLATSLAAGLLIYPHRPLHAAALVLAGTLIDVDHLLLYAAQTGDWSVVGALRYDRYRHRGKGAGDTRPRYASLRSALHDPWLVLPPLWAGAASRPALRPVALGLSLHLLLDYYDWPLRKLAHWRAGGACRSCGRHGLRLTVHRVGRRGEHGYWALCRACSERTTMQGGTPPGGDSAHSLPRRRRQRAVVN